MLIFVLASLISCGFQLRGVVTVPPEMARTYIATNDRHSLFYRRLRDNLRVAGVELVESPVDASSTFSIVSDVTGQRVLAVSARNVPREYEVYYSISYDIKTEEATLLDNRSQTVTRDYTWNETQVLGKEKEQELMREEIVDDLVRTVMIQLSAL